jgi:hypothetical protein
VGAEYVNKTRLQTTATGDSRCWFLRVRLHYANGLDITLTGEYLLPLEVLLVESAFLIWWDPDHLAGFKSIQPTGDRVEHYLLFPAPRALGKGILCPCFVEIDYLDSGNGFYELSDSIPKCVQALVVLAARTKRPGLQDRRC